MAVTQAQLDAMAQALANVNAALDAFTAAEAAEPTSTLDATAVEAAIASTQAKVAALGTTSA